MVRMEGGTNFTFHITCVQKGGNLVQVTEYILCLLLWPLRFIHIHIYLGSLSLVLTPWDTTDKEARLFPRDHHFDKNSNGNNGNLSFVFLFCFPKGYSPELNSPFPATARQVGYIHRQGGSLVTGGHWQADDVQEKFNWLPTGPILPISPL